MNPKTGNPGRCKVDWSNPQSTGCPHGFSEGDHFSSATDAVNHYSTLREQSEDPFATVTAAQRDLNELRKSPSRPLDEIEPQYLSAAVAEKSFWGRHGKKIGGAIVATFVLSTITSLVVGGNGPAENADAIAPLGDDSISHEQVQEDYEDPLPEADQGLTPRELGEETGEKLRDTGEAIKEQITPERIDRLKEAGKGAKDFINGLIDSAKIDPSEIGPFDGPSISIPREVSEGVQFQGQSLQPTAQEVADAQATLASLEVAPENKSAYYDRAEQFGRSFSTGVVGRLEHRDIPQGTFNNPAPQARAIGGSFVDPYTGDTVEIIRGSSTDADVDHIVPLHEVVESESPSRPLSSSDKISIANDFDNLQLVGSSINRSKGDKDPGEWMPPNTSSHLRYAIATINVKSKYGLTVDQAEHDVLSAVLAGRQ